MNKRYAVGLVEEPEYVPASSVIKNRTFKKAPKTEVVFNEKSRRNFITGFRKRKQWRQKRARAEEKAQHKKEVADERRQRKEELKSRNPKLYKRLTKMLGLDQAVDEVEGSDDEENLPTDIQEYVVDEKVVTTTVTPVNMSERILKEEEDEEKKLKEEDGDFGFDLKVPKRKSRRGGKSKYPPKHIKRAKKD